MSSCVGLRAHATLESDLTAATRRSIFMTEELVKKRARFVQVRVVCLFVVG
jgi:hypothetical protein